MLNLYFLTENVKILRPEIHYKNPCSGVKKRILRHFYFPQAVLYFKFSVQNHVFLSFHRLHFAHFPAKRQSFHPHLAAE